MLGQYHIASEILLFAAGLAIASFVAVTFDDLRDSIAETTTRDQMLTVSNLISASLIKGIAENTTIRILVPETISNEVYTISFERIVGGECIIGDCVLRLRTVDSKATVTQQIFNISQSHIINGNVYSGARYIEISSAGNRITISRAGI